MYTSVYRGRTDRGSGCIFLRGIYSEASPMKLPGGHSSSTMSDEGSCRLLIRGNHFPFLFFRLDTTVYYRVARTVKKIEAQLQVTFKHHDWP